MQPSYAPQDHGYAEGPMEPDDRRRNRALLIVTACVVALIGLMGGAFLTLHARQDTVTFSQASGTANTAAGQSSSTIGQLPTDANDVAASGGDVPNAVASDAAANGAAIPTPAPAAAPAPKPAAPAAPAAPAPVITSFHTPDSIDCHNGNSQDFSASWTTTNAVKTTISIDGPGLYKTYGPNADTSLPYTCASAHSFKLTAFGADGKTVTKTITLQPRNVQKPTTNDDDNSAPAAPTAPAPKK